MVVSEPRCLYWEDGTNWKQAVFEVGQSGRRRDVKKKLSVDG